MTEDWHHGTVVSWDAERGFGILTAPALEGTIWTHFSVIQSDEAFRALRPGQAVRVCARTPGQDDHAHSAIAVRVVTDVASG